MNWLTFILFLILNFGALGLGGLFTGDGVPSTWYQELNKAPWTPPGWVFGAAWTTIMICFTFFMTYLWARVEHKSRLVALFVIQWFLNVMWNPVFFYHRQTFLGLIVIFALTLLIGYFLFAYRKELEVRALLVLPYFVWLLIATSLNAYIVFYN